MPEPFFNFSYPPFSIPPPVQEQVAALSDAFAIAGNFLHCETINSGHINMTFRLHPPLYLPARERRCVSLPQRRHAQRGKSDQPHPLENAPGAENALPPDAEPVLRARGSASIWKFPVPASGVATTALKTPTRSTWRTIPARLTKRPGFRRFPTAPVRHESGGHP